MAKLTLNTIGSRYGSIDALNNNSDLVEAAFENTLSRDGTGPNNMEANLDMDSHRVINLADGVGNQDAATVRQVNSIVAAASSGLIASLKERQDAAAGQTVFNLASIQYIPGSNNLAVYIDGVRQYSGEAYTETNATTVTFSAGLTLGAEVMFITNEAVDNANLQASAVQYTPAGTGAVATTVQTKLRETVSVKDFGAVGDGVTDDTAAIQAAADYANSIGGFLSGAPGTYLVTATISLQCSGNLGEMTIEANTNLISPIVRFGTTSGTTTSYKIITLPRVRNRNRTAGTWGAGVGIELANCNTNTIVIPSATECEVGVTCGGYNSGFAYNNVTLMFVYSNKINLRLKPAAGGGWCNQNTFTGGRLGANSADFTISGYVGTRQIVLDKGAATSGGPNNNTFINTSIETDVYEYMIAFEQSASYNQFINCRYEGTNKFILFNTDISSGINSNLFIGGYQASSLDFTYSGLGSSVYNSALNGRTNSVESTGYAFNIVNKASNSVTAPHLQGFDAGQKALGKTAASTDWRYRLYADGLSFKESTESFDKVTIASGQTGNPSVLFGAGTAAPDRGITISGTTALVLENTVSGTTRPNFDNANSLGNASFRWSVVYAGTGTINTSDKRAKQQIRPISNIEKRVAIRLKGLVRSFKFNDAVGIKGDKARIHVGVIAQDVKFAFETEGLDPMQYGIFCYDEWESTKDQPAGNRYGIRYDQLLAFIIGAM